MKLKTWKISCVEKELGVVEVFAHTSERREKSENVWLYYPAKAGPVYPQKV